jgi:hypothetical protein
MGHQVRTNGELAAIYAAGRGYVFNWYTTGPAAARYSLLHIAGCSSVPKMFAGTRPDDEPRRKYFFADAADAESWLSRNVGAEGQRWSRCRSCHATGASVAPSVPVPVSSPGPSPVASVQAGTGTVHRACFARPEGPGLRLRVKPELESFDRREAPGQRRLQHYLETLSRCSARVTPALARIPRLPSASMSACQVASACSRTVTWTTTSPRWQDGSTPTCQAGSSRRGRPSSARTIPTSGLPGQSQPYPTPCRPARPTRSRQRHQR